MKPTLRPWKNGMSVLLMPQEGVPSVTLLVMVKVGSRYETSPINGAAHFIEHMMFKGTKRRPTSELLTQTLDRYGAEYNACTSKDLTAYYIKIDAAQTALAIDLLHDMLFHSHFAAKEMDRERKVILEEINMYEDNPRAHVEDLLEEQLFQGSSLARRITGPREVIRNITRQQLLAFRDAYYIPSRITIAVAGKIVPGTQARLQKTFGSVHASTKKEDHDFSPFTPTSQRTPRLVVQHKTAEQVQLAMAFYGRALGNKDLPAMSLLTTLLGGSMSSRLFIEIRERRGLCYSIHASHEALEDTGAFSISAGLDKKRLAEAIPQIVRQIVQVTRIAVERDELRRAKDHVRGRLMLAFEDSATRAEWYGRQALFGLPLETPEDKLRRIEQVTAADIKRLAKDIFTPDTLSVAGVGPLPSNKVLTGLFRSSFSHL